MDKKEYSERRAHWASLDDDHVGIAIQELRVAVKNGTAAGGYTAEDRQALVDEYRSRRDVGLEPEHKPEPKPEPTEEELGDLQYESELYDQVACQLFVQVVSAGTASASDEAMDLTRTLAKGALDAARVFMEERHASEH